VPEGALVVDELADRMPGDCDVVDRSDDRPGLG
jgi:hypothetical protein